MLRWLSVSMLVSLGGVALACGSASNGSGGGGDGCKPGTSCNTCTNCYELCVCSTGSDQGCQVACDMTGTGGAGASGGSGGGYPVGGTGGGTTGGSGGGGGTTPTGGLATAISISEIALYQGVKVSLMKGGAETPKNAAVVADRESAFRIYVNPEAGYQPREIVARVELGGSAPGTFDAKAFIGGPSNDADGNSTLNVQIPPNAIKQDTTYKVSLLESAGSYPGSVAAAEWGASPLGAQFNGVFEVILVPVSINGIVPKTDATSIKAYHDRMMKLYPVPEVDIQVRAVAQYSGTTPQANGQGWNSLLNWLMQLRSLDKPPGKKYYYGVIAPASSFQTFCGFGCVAGLSSQTQAQDDPVYRVGSGVGFFPSGSTPSSPDTMAHEVGHTAGLGHAPCVPPGSQIQGVDPNYPYAGASIGTWGWDLITKNYLDPAKYKDMMSYCDPYIHVADWTFDKLFKRIAYTNAANDAAVPNDAERGPGKFDSLLVNDDGSLEWGYPIDSPWWLKADKKVVDLVDDAGKLVGSATGFWYPHDHGGGGTLLVRHENLIGNPSAQTLKLSGAALSLPH